MSKSSVSKTYLTPSLFNDFFKPWNEWVNGGSLWNNVMTVPAVNVTEKNSHYLITLAAPGLTKDEFDISMDGNMMTISAEKEESKEEKEDKVTRKEYNYNSFSRSFTLPEDVKQDGIEAAYENGILSVRLPKTEASRKGSLHKTIAVK